ncbi:Outer membrane protein induced after carbon starvation [Shigella sonnei]|nr:Outer membrane protein induced after carbon starvation [Shigella sonnei]
MGRWILMPRPKINGIELNKRDINIRQVYVTIRHIASESDENYKEIDKRCTHPQPFIFACRM